MAQIKLQADGLNLADTFAFTGTVTGGGDLSFGGDTFGADKTIGSNDTYSLSLETDGTERLKLHSDGRGLSQFTAKAWINFTGVTTTAIRDSHNVSSISDTSTGRTVISFSNNMASTDYVTVANHNGYNIVTSWQNGAEITPWYPSVGSVKIITTVDAAYYDSALVSVVIFGD